MLQEIDYPRSSPAKKPKTSINPASILTESFHVNHILNDVMSRILHDMFEKHHHPVVSAAAQPRASRKGELLFVKKQNTNNDAQYTANSYNLVNNHNHTNPTSKQSKVRTRNRSNRTSRSVVQASAKGEPSSSSSSSTSSASSTCSSSMPTKTRHASKAGSSTKYIPRGRSGDNSKIIIGTDGKQIRPKRGQYRRYESEQLAKAVAAVLSNEMSVHKAGSYFGVPHSTVSHPLSSSILSLQSISVGVQSQRAQYQSVIIDQT